MEIGKLIKKRRKECNFTVQKICKIMGVCKMTVYQWEKGICNPTLENVQKLEAILNLGYINKEHLNKEVFFK